MKLNTTLLLCILQFGFTSCNGQNDVPTNILGEVVLEMDKNIWVIFQDSKNNYWFGSDGEGVYRYTADPNNDRERKPTFIHLNSKQGLAGDRVREIKEDEQGNIYINTSEGISKLDGQKIITLKVSADNDPQNWKSEPNDLWFKGGEKGPYRYDGKHLYKLAFPKNDLEEDYFKQYPNASIDPYDIYYIYKDSKGHIWFGTGAFGVYRFDGNHISTFFEEHLTTVPGGGSFGIRSIMEDRKGKFWFCNTKYLYNITPGESPEKGLINYTKEKNLEVSNDPLGDDRIYYQSIVEDSKGDIWMQTYQGGIWRYDGKKLTHYPVKDGAETANVISLYQDNYGGLWLGTNGSGVYKFYINSFEPSGF